MSCNHALIVARQQGSVYRYFIDLINETSKCLASMKGCVGLINGELIRISCPVHKTDEYISKFAARRKSTHLASQYQLFMHKTRGRLNYFQYRISWHLNVFTCCWWFFGLCALPWPTLQNDLKFVIMHGCCDQLMKVSPCWWTSYIRWMSSIPLTYRIILVLRLVLRVW